LIAAGLALPLAAGPAASQIVESLEPLAPAPVESAAPAAVPAGELGLPASVPVDGALSLSPLPSQGLSLPSAALRSLPRSTAERAPRALPGLAAAAEPKGKEPKDPGAVFDLSRRSLALGAAAGVLAPIAWGAAPPLSVIHTGLAAFGSFAAVSAGHAMIRVIVQRARGDREAFARAGRSTAARSLLFGAASSAALAVGAALVGPVNSALGWYAAGAGLLAAGSFASLASTVHAVYRGRPVRPALVAAAGAAVGLALGAAPDAFVNPAFVANTAITVLWALAGAARITARVYRKIRRRQDGSLPTTRYSRWAETATFALGVGLGAAPHAVSGEVAVGESRLTERGAQVLLDVPDAPARVPSSWKPLVPLLAQKRGFRVIGPAFGKELVSTIQEYPQGRMVLDGLRDRGGTLRPPVFLVGKLDDGASGFYFPVFNAVILSEDEITEEGWTVDEFLADPAKQRELAQKKDTIVLHELYHAKQFRHTILFDGQLDHFPNQLGAYLRLEMEYETYFEEMVYIHQKLQADPHADIPDSQMLQYELFIADLDDFWRGLDDSGLYDKFQHVDSARDQHRLAEMRARWPAISEEGKELLKRRLSTP
jgi:hypothetical protein